MSHGCIRMLREHIEQLYPLVEVNMQGEIIYEPVKIAQHRKAGPTSRSAPTSTGNIVPSRGIFQSSSKPAASPTRWTGRR
jgi:hypothetical protein